MADLVRNAFIGLAILLPREDPVRSFSVGPAFRPVGLDPEPSRSTGRGRHARADRARNLFADRATWLLQADRARSHFTARAPVRAPAGPGRSVFAAP
jgi:hypothetical protein